MKSFDNLSTTAELQINDSHTLKDEKMNIIIESDYNQEDDKNPAVDKESSKLKLKQKLKNMKWSKQGYIQANSRYFKKRLSIKPHQLQSDQNQVKSNIATLEAVQRKARTKHKLLKGKVSSLSEVQGSPESSFYYNRVKNSYLYTTVHSKTSALKAQNHAIWLIKSDSSFRSSDAKRTGIDPDNSMSPSIRADISQNTR